MKDFRDQLVVIVAGYPTKRCNASWRPTWIWHHGSISP
jgi:hypothetical protein